MRKIYFGTRASSIRRTIYIYIYIYWLCYQIRSAAKDWILGSMDPLDLQIHGSRDAMDPWILGSLDHCIHGSIRSILASMYPLGPWILGSMDESKHAPPNALTIEVQAVIRVYVLELWDQRRPRVIPRTLPKGSHMDTPNNVHNTLEQKNKPCD